MNDREKLIEQCIKARLSFEEAATILKCSVTEAEELIETTWQKMHENDKDGDIPF